MVAWIPCAVVMLAAAAASVTSTYGATNMLNASTTTKPCKRECGSLTVPYPFGIGVGGECSLGHGYDIQCNMSFNPPKLYLGNGSLEIVEIAETYMKIKNRVARACYNSQGDLISKNEASIDLSTYPLTFSYTLNKFHVVGCDDMALLISDTKNNFFNPKKKTKTKGGYSFSSAWVSMCSKPKDVRRGICYGIGCSKIYVPIGLQRFTASLQSYSNHKNVSSFDSCGYAFLAEAESFTFRGLADLSDPSFVDRILENVPIVLEWYVWEETTCSQAQQNLSSYACQQNTNCTDIDLGFRGYRCSCLPGFEGNPYLSPGCTDIDECAGPNNPCSNRCTNTPGAYHCSCPKWHHGDGLKSGTGCASNTSHPWAIVIGGGIGCMVVIGCYWVFQLTKKMGERRARASNFSRNGGLLLEQFTSSKDTMERTKMFTARELEKATDRFNESRILGQGGQGTVYKGMLADGRIVAIKKSKKVNEDQTHEFINELAILSEINHKNIVKLIGCCLETEVPLLVYEFVPNGTLSHHIHHPSEDFHLTWKMRLRIAADLAGALAYLHSSLSASIYHRDIKSSNFLLDDKYKAKISDFGISRSISIDQTHLTTCVQGTFGYLDPEYFYTHQFTDKSDVYSFGVILVELLTSKPPFSATTSEDCKSLVVEFSSAVENSCLLQFLDSQVVEEGKEDELCGVANLALQCLRMSGQYRPTMKEVAVILEGIISSPQAPLLVEEHCLEIEPFGSQSASDVERLFHSNTSSLQDETQPSIIVQPLLHNTL